MDNQKYDEMHHAAEFRQATEFRQAAKERLAGLNPDIATAYGGASGGGKSDLVNADLADLEVRTIASGATLPGAPPREGGNLTAAATAVSEAYPHADQAMVAKNHAEINEAVAKAAQPKLVRHLMEQRRDEALHEAKRLQDLIDTSPTALLDCTLDAAMKIFG